MITPNQCFTCVCQKCHKEWMTQSNKLPAVCRYCKTTKWNDDYTPVSTPKKTILDHVKELTTAQRMTLFDAFELCCGMNRGACVCEAEAVQIVQSIPKVADEPKDALAAFIAKAQASKGIVPSEIITQAEPIADEWIFTKDKPDFPDNGNVYRTQYLAANPKHRRTVRVDEYDYDLIA
jgi:hypothetical protein